MSLVKDFLESPGMPAAAAVAGASATRVRETFEKKGLVATAYVDAQVERALLGGRHFQRRSLLGKTHVRAIVPGDSERGAACLCGRRPAAKLPARRSCACG
ncbi:MAG: hypothetical protein R3B70_44835 [Polyangiaceae bacterium]